MLKVDFKHTICLQITIKYTILDTSQSYWHDGIPLLDTPLLKSELETLENVVDGGNIWGMGTGTDNNIS